VKRQIMAVSPRKLSGLPDRVATYEPQGIAAQDQGLFPRAKPEQSDFGDLDTRVQPRPIGAKQKFARSGAANGLYDIVEATNPRSVGINVGVPYQLINDLLHRPEVIGKAAQMRDDEIDVAILRGEHLDMPGLSANIDQHR